jgi:MFS family permease
VPERAAASPPQTTAERLLVLAAVCLAGLAMPLSFTGPAVALPAIGRDLGGDPVALGWVVNAFILAFGGSVLAAGTLADRFGRKRVFAVGIASFAAVSLVLGLAPGVLWLDALRAAQGVAAALAMSAGAASLAQVFEGHARTRAYSLLGTTFGLGLAFGPLLSAWLVEAYGWRAVFFGGSVIGVLVLAFGVPRMRESRDPDATGLDRAGTLAFTAALTLLTFAIVEAPQRGWGDARVLGLFAAAFAALAGFVAVERRAARPMLDLSLFRYRRFIGVQALPLATALCYVVLLILLPVRFIGIEGRGEIEAGLLMIPLSAPMLVVPFLGAVLARRLSAALLSGAGLLVAAAGLLWLGRTAPAAPAAGLVLPLLLIGAGSGLPWGLMDDLSVSVVPKERAGMATGIFTTTRVAGEAIMLAAAGALLTALTQAGLAHLPAADEAGRVLAAGHLERALALLAGAADRASAVAVYEQAFAAMLHVLATATALLALAAFALLKAGGRDAAARGALRPEPPAACA